MGTEWGMGVQDEFMDPEGFAESWYSSLRAHTAFPRMASACNHDRACAVFARTAAIHSSQLVASLPFMVSALPFMAPILP
eukprot:1040465-Rhodomonas_salina.1